MLEFMCTPDLSSITHHHGIHSNHHEYTAFPSAKETIKDPTYDKDNEFAKVMKKSTRPPGTHVIYEDSMSLTFLNPKPLTPGDLILIPKLAGKDSLFSLPTDYSAHLGDLLPDLAKTMRDKGGCTGVTVLMNVGKDGGQAIGHPSFNLYCNKPGAHPPLIQPAGIPTDPSELKQLAQEMTKEMKAVGNRRTCAYIGKLLMTYIGLV